MLILAGGMFLVHSTLSGFLNHSAVEHKGVVNGIYVSVYYLSGTLGSWLPIALYQSAGWRNTLLACHVGFSLPALRVAVSAGWDGVRDGVPGP